MFSTDYTFDKGTTLLYHFVFWKYYAIDIDLFASSVSDSSY